MSGKRRKITVTEREFHAMCAAFALYQAEYDGNADDWPEAVRDVQAHNRLVRKWHGAGRRYKR